MYFKTGMSENGTIHISMMKNWVSHVLFHRRKRGLIVYLAALKKGAIQAAYPYYEVCPESSWTTCPQLNLNNNRFLHLYHDIQECIRNTCVKNDKNTTSTMSFTTVLI